MNTLTIDLAPGCGRKLSVRHIEEARKILMGIGVDGVSKDWADATPLSAHGELFASIDTSVRSQAWTKDFFRFAILHAMRDLQSNFCKPNDISIAVRFDENSINRDLREFSESVADVSRAATVRVGKIHSLLGSGPTEVTVSVVGQRLRTKPPLVGDRFDLFLLGSIDTSTDGIDRNWNEALHDANLLLESGDVILAKDVSGDGLAGALWQIAEDTGLSVILSLSDVPFNREEVPLDDCNLDRNLYDFERRLQVVGELDRLHRALLMKPQFCGPFLVIAPTGYMENCMSSVRFKKIGECEFGTSAVKVNI